MKNKDRLREINRDLELLANPSKIDYRKKYHELYDEYSRLISEVLENDEYRRVYGEKEPRRCDLSKGKLSERLSKKIVRIKELWETKEKYEEMDKYNSSMESGEIVEGSIGNIVSDIQILNPIHNIDTNDKFSVLRHYNQGVSNEFVDKNIRILREN